MGTLYLIPSLLHEEGVESIPGTVLDAIKKCQVFLVENERTTRRYFKKLWKEMVIDDYDWLRIGDEDKLGATVELFKQRIREGKNIGIVSEAGSPGIADPGQVFVAIAQQLNMDIQPLAGPNSILLALMASGMNGQEFQFNGYLPIPESERSKAIRRFESISRDQGLTQIFIETPYRNNQLFESFLKNCGPETRICIAVNLTAPVQWIKTKTVAEWKEEKPEMHKKPAIFLLDARKG
jgi:16S rRNA (cytidine1402-2'-O)-methyltransferase